MIPVAAGARIWIVTGHTDMRKGMQGLALLVQEGLGRDPFAGDVFMFRGRAGTLIKALWHDGVGLSLYAKRLDRGRFIWPATVDGVVSLTQLRWAICWRRSTRATHNTAGGRRALDKLRKNPRRLQNRGFCDSISGWVIVPRSCRKTLRRCRWRCWQRVQNWPASEPNNDQALIASPEAADREAEP